MKDNFFTLPEEFEDLNKKLLKMKQIGNFEEWLRNELLSVGDVLDCVGARIYNSAAPPNAAFPYLIFNVIPLGDKTGQAGATIQTVLLCDVQIYSRLPKPPDVDLAITSFNNKIEKTRGIRFKETNIALRHDKPISRMTGGATADEKIIVRGATFKVWLSGCS